MVHLMISLQEVGAHGGAPLPSGTEIPGTEIPFGGLKGETFLPRVPFPS